MVYFPHITAVFVNIPFVKEDQILIKDLYLLKGYIVHKLLKEFPSNSWNEQSSKAAKSLKKTVQLTVVQAVSE